MTIFSQTKPAQTHELEITFTLSSVINVASIVQVTFYVVAHGNCPRRANI